MKKRITQFVDFFYIKPLRFVPLETFRYAFVGGVNVLLGMFLYWFCFHFVLQKEDTDFGIVVISAPILTFLITFPITFFTGFYLTRNVAFSKSTVRGRKQLFRYAQVVAVNIALNYFGLKLLVDVCGFYPTPSYAAVQVFIMLFSYLAQRFYTFRIHRCEE